MTEPGGVTAEALLRMPEDHARLELVRGVLVERPFAGLAAGRAAAALNSELSRAIEPGALGEIYLGVGFHLGHEPDTVRAAAVAFVSAGRVEAARRIDPDELGFFPGPPDLAVEIASSWDGYDLMVGKTLDWLAAGTGLVWLISPASRSVVVVRSRNDITVLTEDDVLDGGDVVPGWRLPVRDVFA
jgi:Uma2 family endonuclease